MGGQVGLVDDEQIALGDARTALAWDLVAAGHVDHVDRVVDQLAAVLGGEVVAAGLDEDRIRAVETGGCPHAAIREDISHNLVALEELMDDLKPELLLVESGGDNLAAQFSRELVDYTIYVIDVSGGDKIPRKGGPGITQSDLLVVNKTDLATLVGADLGVMERDAKKMRGDGPTVFAQIKNDVGVDAIIEEITRTWYRATART